MNNPLERTVSYLTSKVKTIYCKLKDLTDVVNGINSYPIEDQEKLATIEEGAEVNFENTLRYSTGDVTSETVEILDVQENPTGVSVGDGQISIDRTRLVSATDDADAISQGVPIGRLYFRIGHGLDVVSSNLVQLDRYRDFYFSRFVSTGDYHDNIQENVAAMPNFQQAEYSPVADLDGYIYYFDRATMATVHVFDSYSNEFVEIISLNSIGVISYCLETPTYNPIDHKIYSTERYTGDLIVYDIYKRTLTRHPKTSSISGQWYTNAVWDINYENLYITPTIGQYILKWNIKNKTTSTITIDNTLAATSTSYNAPVRIGVMASNGCIYYSPMYATKIVKLNTFTDTLSYIDIDPTQMHFGFSSGSGFFYYATPSADGRYILISQSHTGNYNGGNLIRIDTENNDSLTYLTYPNLANFTTQLPSWSQRRGAKLMPDGLIYFFPYAVLPGNDRVHAYNIEDNTWIEVDDAMQSGFLHSCLSSNGHLYANRVFTQNDPQIARIIPFKPIIHDPKQIILLQQ